MTFKRLNQGILAVGVALAPMALGGCGFVSPQRTAANAIRDRLPSMIGPAQSYDVSVAGGAFALSRGHASEVRIHGVGVQINPTLTLDDVFIDSHDLNFDRSTHKLTHADDTTATVSIGAQNLSNYLHARHPNWSDLQLAFSNQDIQAQLPLNILDQTAQVNVLGQFVPSPDNPSDLDLHVDSASVASVPVPISLVNYALKRVNPIVSLHSLRYPVQVQSAKVANGLLTIQGNIQLTQ